jgi:methylglutaconyl-CoA hydratase
MADDLLVATDARGIATLTLNRPATSNAFDDRLVAALGDAIARAGADSGVRVVVLAGAGPNFCAGADLNWMKRAAAFSQAENEADARKLGAMFRALDTLPKPTVALVRGAAYAGGVGLVAACDIAIAADDAAFSISETRLGLIPAVISPYLIAAIGPRAARRYVLTAERFDAVEALRIGLVHAIVPAAALAATGARIAETLAANAPGAVAAAKRLIADIAGRPRDDALVADTARRIAEARASAEGREGIASFLEKRAPALRR